jgi:hypothetical protein
MNKTMSLACAGLAVAAIALGGCKTSAQTGSLVGAGLGGTVGAIIGHNNNDHKAAGALIGTGVGALAGYAIGNELDKTEQGTHWRGDPRYDPGVEDGGRAGPYDSGPSYDDGSGRERVIYRERTVYETGPGTNCR